MRRWMWKLGVLMVPMFVLACGVSGSPDELRDLRTLPQDLNAYIVPGTAERALLPGDRQKQLSDNYRRSFLAPWQSTSRAWSAHDMFAIRRWLLDNPLFGSNYQPIPMQLRQQWLALCAQEQFPNADYPAITLRASNLRGLPTRQPAFYKVDRPGEGFPFDYLQSSSVPASTPVRVRQRSADGGWVLVETAAMFGWLPSTDVAAVDKEIIERFAASSWCVVVADDVMLADENGQVLATVGLGSLLVQGTAGKVWVAVRGADGIAHLQQSTIAPDAIRPFPLPLTPGHMAALGNRLLGNPYDWGGQFGGRDCSATLRDLFACFGLYLPRNSAGQARAGKWLNLRHVPAEKRESFIMSQAEPWLSLAYMPGHIMLYVGMFRGQPVFLHTFWGVKTKDRHGTEGRYLVGRTVISGLRVGEELDDLMRPNGLLLERLEGMVLLRASGER